ncbi:response regulator transcription factor [Pseudomonas fluorescens]|uniref:response regulator transcription factor n=1 Tax=Pseudomonas fluorescens TaxID=294 RepID=UPI001BE7645C|nr:response regulator transcription factor [Pseudomonas fluorescens]MBT2375388.1 response regulator transcription factor [Pseudomonas fluorescens]
MDNRVIIVDDHPVVRMAVRYLVEREGYKVVGEAEDGAQALNLIHELQPGTVILDIGLPKVDGIAVLNGIGVLRLPVKFIVLTAQVSNYIAKRCMEAGGHGFVSKHDDLRELVNALQSVKNGDHYYSESTLLLTRHEVSVHRGEELLKTLSIRELGVLQLLVQGLSNQQISERMLLSSTNINAYKTRLLIKLNASSLVDLYDLARRNGLAES